MRGAFPDLRRTGLVLALGAGLAGACSRQPAPPAPVHRHEHHPPHGGTPVVLGDEAYHLELVRDPQAGTLQAFLLDGEMENFVRAAMPSIEIVARAGGAERILAPPARAQPGYRRDGRRHPPLPGPGGLAPDHSGIRRDDQGRDGAGLDVFRRGVQLSQRKRPGLTDPVHGPASPSTIARTLCRYIAS